MMQSTEKADSGRRRRMIAEAAYFRAERRNFQGGDPVSDWIEAEREIEAVSDDTARSRLLDRIEEQVATANRKLKSLKRRVSRMKSEARKEWQQEAERLAELRDSLKKRLDEIRERSGDSSRKAQKQAEKIWEEISDVIQRTTSRRK